MLRLSISLLLPQQWWVPSSPPVKVLKAITPTETLLWRLDSSVVGEEVQMWCFPLFVSIAEELTAALQQVMPHWKHRVAQRLADATLLELKWLHGQWDMFSKSHFCALRWF